MTSGSTKIEDRYCRCIMHVANQYPAYNPYAVCTHSIYQQAGKKRTKVVECSKRYSFEDFKTDELHGYAKMKKLPHHEGLSRDELIKALYRYVAKTKGMKVWQQYVKEIRKDYPNLSFKQAVKRASDEYKKEKEKLGV